MGRSYWDQFREANCPNCQSPLYTIEKNYSGCGVDIVECDKCKRAFQVSYKIDKITRVPEFEEKNSEEIKLDGDFLK